MTAATVARWENLTEAGRRFLAQGDESRAEEAFRAAVAEAEQIPDGLPLHATTLEALAQLKLRQQQLGESEELFRRALALRERAFGADHPVVAITLNGLAAAYAARGAFSAAEGVLRRALLAVQGDPSAHRELAATLSALSKLYFRQGEYDQAEPHLLHLLELKQQRLGRDHPEVAAVLTSLAALRGALGRHDHAEQLLRKALAIRERVSSPNAAAVATLRGKLADAIASQGRRDEAAAVRRQSVPTASADPRPSTVPTRTEPVEDEDQAARAAAPPATVASPSPSMQRAPLYGDAPAALAFGANFSGTPLRSELQTATQHVLDATPLVIPASPLPPARPADADAVEPLAIAPLIPEREPTPASAVWAAPAPEPFRKPTPEPVHEPRPEPSRERTNASEPSASAPLALEEPLEAPTEQRVEERVELIAEPPIVSAPERPAEASTAAPDSVWASRTKPPRSAALLAAAAALAEYEAEPTAAPVPAPTSRRRSPRFDPSAPLWPRADRVASEASPRPAAAAAPLFPPPPAHESAPIAVEPIAPIPGPTPAPEPIAQPRAASAPRRPIKLPRPAIRVNVRLTRRQRRTAGVLAAALVGIFVLGTFVERMATPAPHAAVEPPPVAVEDPPDHPVDEDDPSRLPSLSGDAIGWVPAPGQAAAQDQPTGRTRGGEVARTEVPRAEAEQAEIERLQAAATLGGTPATPRLPKAPRIRVDLRAVDAKVREGAKAAEDPLARMPSVMKQP
jgi:tetratricopeptide (TPR) repeat protein